MRLLLHEFQGFAQSFRLNRYRQRMLIIIINNPIMTTKNIFTHGSILEFKYYKNYCKLLQFWENLNETQKFSYKKLQYFISNQKLKRYAHPIIFFIHNIIHHSFTFFVCLFSININQFYMSNLLNQINNCDLSNIFFGEETESNHRHSSFINRDYHNDSMPFLENSFNYRLQQSYQKEEQILYQSKFGNDHLFSFEDKPEDTKIFNIFQNQHYSQIASLAQSDNGSIELQKKIKEDLSEIEVTQNSPKLMSSNPQNSKRRCTIIRKQSNITSERQSCIISEDINNSLKPIKNETKNIPKNYGKAIISFIQKNKEKVIQILQFLDIDYNDLIDEFKLRKKTINTISDLRNLWINSRFAKPMRILSNLFLRKYSLKYIFNSRITNFTSHIKYRHKLREALMLPANFKNIKDY